MPLSVPAMLSVVGIVAAQLAAPGGSAVLQPAPGASEIDAYAKVAGAVLTAIAANGAI